MLDVTVNTGPLWQALASGPVCMLILSAEGVIQYVNASYSRLTGYASEEVVGQPLTLPRVDGSETPIGEVLQYFQNGKSWVGELVRPNRDGVPIWINTVFSPLYDDKGVLGQILVLEEDVTEKRRVEMELAKSHQAASQLLTRIENAKKEWERVIDCVDEMLVYIKPDGRIARGNSAFATFMGRPLKQILGEPEEILLQQFGVEFEQIDGHCYHLWHGAPA